MNFELTLFTSSDIQGLIELSASVGWDYDAYEIETIMAAGRIVGHKNMEGKIVSCAAIIPYDTNVASIGMVIVHEQCRGFGLGRIVTQACIDSVSAETAIMLVATKEGEPLYQKWASRLLSMYINIWQTNLLRRPAKPIFRHHQRISRTGF